MNRKYRIGFVVSLSVIVLCLIFLYQFSYQKNMQKKQTDYIETENAQQTEGAARKEDGYIITEKDGHVIVYYSDQTTIYEYTTILTEHLPDEIYKELKNGLYMRDIKDVYGFLENYSS